MRVLISNVYSYKNKGDAAIVISLLREVERAFPAADVLVQTADIKNDAGKYGAPITSSLLWTLLSSMRDQPMVKRLWVVATGILGLRLYLLLFTVFGRAPLFVVPRHLHQFIRDNQQADIVIACGGGYLRTASNSLEDALLLSVTCLNFLAAKRLGKPVFLYSQSIGPVHGGWQHRILRRALNEVDIIEPREDVSLAFLDDIDPESTIVPTADPALLLGNTGKFPEQHVQLRPDRLHVGLTVRKWFKSEQQLSDYINAVAQTIDYLVEERNAEVFYVPQVIAENFGDDDRVIARRVRDATRNKEYFTVVEADLHPFEVIGLCGNMDIFIGTRMHSNIFALINHVPVVAIEYEHKTKGIMRGLGLEPLTIDIRDVTYETLKEKVDTLLKDPDHYRNLIKTNLPGQIADSRRAIDVIKEEYEIQSA
jgi:colanic acid/amylovoran biosynthesis protein